MFSTECFGIFDLPLVESGFGRVHWCRGLTVLGVIGRSLMDVPEGMMQTRPIIIIVHMLLRMVNQALEIFFLGAFISKVLLFSACACKYNPLQ